MYKPADNLTYVKLYQDGQMECETAIQAKMEKPNGFYFFGHEDALKPFYGEIKEPIKFYKSLKRSEIRKYYRMVYKDIEKLSLYEQLTA